MGRFPRWINQCFHKRNVMQQKKDNGPDKKVTRPFIFAGDKKLLQEFCSGGGESVWIRASAGCVRGACCESCSEPEASAERLRVLCQKQLAGNAWPVTWKLSRNFTLIRPWKRMMGRKYFPFRGYIGVKWAFFKWQLLMCYICLDLRRALILLTICGPPLKLSFKQKLVWFWKWRGKGYWRN